MALEGSPELGRLYLLLGPPHLEMHRTAYVRAKNLLHRMPIPHELVEEDEAGDFAKQLADYMRQHGVLKEEEQAEQGQAEPVALGEPESIPHS